MHADHRQRGSRILIVFGTRNGQTAKIAAHSCDVLTGLGFGVTLARGDAIPATLMRGDYAGVMVGASVILGQHQPSILAFVRDNLAWLSAVPTAFFSVSGWAGSDSLMGRERARRYLREFLSVTGWHPSCATTIAGAIAYTHYRWPLRWVMRRVAARMGAATDGSRDHEYTDWPQVERFARHFASLVPRVGRRAEA